MKRSTIFILVILSLCIIAPIIYICLVARDVKNNMGNIKEWVSEYIDVDESSASYILNINSTDSISVPDCYIYVTTYTSSTGGDKYVHIVNPVTGVNVKQENHLINVDLNEVSDMEGDGLILTIELPKNSILKVENKVAAVDIVTGNADLNRLMLVSPSDIKVEDSNIGAISSVEQLTQKSMLFDDSNIGLIQFNGDYCSVEVDNSNIGAMTISGTCQAISMSESQIGVCSWNRACSNIAVIDDCDITTLVDEHIFQVTVDDVAIDTTAMEVQVSSDSDRVEISPSGMLVESEDGESVKVSIDGVHVDADGTKVDISPAGVRVVENGEEVVSVGVGGIKVK